MGKFGRQQRRWFVCTGCDYGSHLCPKFTLVTVASFHCYLFCFIYFLFHLSLGPDVVGKWSGLLGAKCESIDVDSLLYSKWQLLILDHAPFWHVCQTLTLNNKIYSYYVMIRLKGFEMGLLMH